MRVWLWMLFFMVCNIVGVEVFKAAFTLPLEDAMLPRLLAVPMIGLTAFGATRLLGAWTERED